MDTSQPNFTPIPLTPPPPRQGRRTTWIDYARRNTHRLQLDPGATYLLVDICRTLTAGPDATLATTEYAGATITTGHRGALDHTTTITTATPDDLATTENRILAALATHGPATIRQLQRHCQIRALASVAAVAGHLDRLETAGKATSSEGTDRAGRKTTVWTAVPGATPATARRTPRTPAQRLAAATEAEQRARKELLRAAAEVRELLDRLQRGFHANLLAVDDPVASYGVDDQPAT